MKVLVTIIIPCFNVEEYIAECLDSAIAQIHSPIEIIAVDNNSTDGTLKILNEYASKYPELVSVLQEEKQGPSAARNKGMSIAKGEWLQFLDADDLLMPTKISDQLNLVQNETSIIMIAGTHIIRYLNGKEKKCIPQEGDVFKALANCNIGYTVSNLFKFLNKKIQPFWDENIIGPEDNAFIFEYLKLNPKGIIYDYLPFTFTRERLSGQITKTNLLEFNKSCLIFQLRLMRFLEENQKKYYDFNKQFFMDNLYYYVYRIALSNPEYGNQCLKELFDKGYYPSYKREGRITKIHTYGFKLLGFRNYAVFRKLFF